MTIPPSALFPFLERGGFIDTMFEGYSEVFGDFLAWAYFGLLSLSLVINILIVAGMFGISMMTAFNDHCYPAWSRWRRARALARARQPAAAK
jgi:hypothetical protein